MAVEKVSETDATITYRDSAEISTFMDKPVKPAIPFSWEWTVYKSNAAGIQAAKDAGEWPSNDAAIVKEINADVKLRERQKVYAEKTKDLRTAYEQTRDFKVANLAKAFEASGKSPEEALKLAEQFTK